MGGAVKWVEKQAEKHHEEVRGTVRKSRVLRADPLIGGVTGTFKSPTGTIDQDPSIDQGAPITIAGPGGMDETDAALLHDRYTSKAELDKLKLNRSTEINGLLGSAMEQAKGLNSVENAAIRNSAMASINSQNQGALRNLRASQASSGVRGGLASAQYAQQQGQATQAVAEMERNLVADNINYKREGTKNALSAFTNQENIERDMAADKLNTVLAIRAENASLEAARMQAEAAANSGRRGGKGGGK